MTGVRVTTPPEIPSQLDRPAAHRCADAAERYHDEFGWACGALDGEVWIRLATGTGAAAVDQPLAGRLRDALHSAEVHSPIVECPGRPGYWIFLVAGPRTLEPPTRVACSAHGMTYRGASRLIDLPPTQSPSGELRWIDPPTPGVIFPDLDALLSALDALG
jgi:hypothetical protein